MLNMYCVELCGAWDFDYHCVFYSMYAYVYSPAFLCARCTDLYSGLVFRKWHFACEKISRTVGSYRADLSLPCSTAQ